MALLSYLFIYITTEWVFFFIFAKDLKDLVS